VTYYGEPTGGTANLYQLEKVGVPSYTGHPKRDPNKHVLGQIRYQAIEDTAMSLGARSALAWRSQQINEILQENEPELDATYNFQGLMLPENVLPPVLAQARNILNLAGPDTIRLAQHSYKIVEQARFVTAPPTWRDYLWLDYPQPSLPDKTLLPRNKAEKSIWRHFVHMGWNNGINQANSIFSANLNTLNRDFNGMILYRELYQQNMVSAPFVARTNLGITGDGSQMSIDDRVLRITALPQLNLNGSTWKPILIPDPLDQRRLKQQLETQIGNLDSGSTEYGYVK
jgi:defect-in-organelle-trafficking protein DotC